MEKEKRRILIIDDDLDNLQLSKDVLQFNGFETYDFIDPRLALDTFKQSPQSYDLILMDIKMQEMDGYFLYKEIKQTNPDAKVLVFTGMILDVNEFKKICPSFEEKQLIQKPVRMSSLVKTVNEAMTSI
jgi:CheY-like chemotaxis protein